MPLLSGHTTPSITPSATSPALSDLDDGGFLFRTAISDAAQGPILAQLVAADLEIPEEHARRLEELSRLPLDYPYDFHARVREMTRALMPKA